MGWSMKEEFLMRGHCLVLDKLAQVSSNWNLQELLVSNLSNHTIWIFKMYIKSESVDLIMLSTTKD